MLSKSKSMTGGPGNRSGPQKKKAPPRPPPPSTSKIQSSQSFRTAEELQSQKISSYGQRPSLSVDYSGRGGRNDLIDFSTPPGSPESSKKALDSSTKSKGPPDFMYRVGASIFYVKSQLKNPTTINQTANPFSPPRPSPQSLLSSPAKFSAVAAPPSSLYNSSSTTVPQNGGTVIMNNSSNNFTTTTAASNPTMKYHPTIIKRPNENNNSIKFAPGNDNRGGSFRSSSGSSDWSDNSQQTQQQQEQPPRYGNVPMPTWDEPPTQHYPPKTASIIMPTIIKPPSSTKPSLLPKPNIPGTRTSANSTTFTTNFSDATDSVQQRNYYDDPPDSDFDDIHEDNIVSPPMPNVPPPPPPADLALSEWVDSTKDAPAYRESAYDNQGVETDRAYAIALYDYLPEGEEGDLLLQAGDLVYLIKKIDDEWLYGQCAGVEGMFPSNYVNVVVPLSEETEPLPPLSNFNNLQETKTYSQCHFADALYKFDAETDGDLSLRVGDMVKIYGRVNDEWLYGEVMGHVGQFPAAFVDPVPSDLPNIPNGS